VVGKGKKDVPKIDRTITIHRESAPMDKAEVKTLHERMLGDCVDAALVVHGFQRRARSTVYKRKLTDGHQEIDVDFQLPRYGDDSSLAHILPVLRVYFPQAHAHAQAYLDAPDDYVAGKVTTSVPLGAVGPEGRLRDWRPTDERTYLEQGREIAAYLVQWAVPFLRELEMPGALASRMRVGDARLPGHVIFQLLAAGAAEATGDVECARAILGAAVRTPKMKRQYQKALRHFGLE
jgi:hypothetical protein